MFETETWYFRGDMKILLGHLNWGLDTNGRPSGSADNIFLSLFIVRNIFKWTNLLLKMG